MDLGKQLTIDDTKADEGVWFRFLDDAEFKVRAANTIAHRAITAEVTERYRAQLRVGGAVAVEARLAIQQEVTARYHIADWKGISENGVVLECNDENRMGVCQRYIQVMLFVQGCASEISAYRLETDEAGRGN